MLALLIPRHDAISAMMSSDRAQLRPDDDLQRMVRQGDADRPGWLVPDFHQFVDLGFELLDTRRQRADEPLSGFCWNDASGGPCQKPQSHPVLKLRVRPANTFREPSHPGDDLALVPALMLGIDRDLRGWHGSHGDYFRH